MTTKREIEKGRKALARAYKHVLIAMEEYQAAGLPGAVRDVSSYADEIQMKADAEFRKKHDLPDTWSSSWQS